MKMQIAFQDMAKVTKRVHVQTGVSNDSSISYIKVYF